MTFGFLVYVVFEPLLNGNKFAGATQGAEFFVVLR